jgi:hypothetical protein
LNFSIRSLVIVLGFFILPAAALGDVYDSANFSGGIFGGGANVSAPFAGNGFTPGDTFTGNFVYDVNKIPSPVSGFDNVFFSNFPDIAAIPPSTVFSLSIGGLTFTLANALVQFPTQEAAIQYNNGNFNGFFYISDFTFLGNPYELSLQGGILSIHALDSGGNPEGSSLVNGYVQIGNPSLTNISPFTPVSTTPEPSSILLFVTGLLGIIFVMRQRT